MNTIGIIGQGEIGGVLARGFLRTETVKPSDLYVFDRHPEKIERLTKEFGGVNVCSDAAEAAHNARYLFICIQPPFIPQLVKELKKHINPGTNLMITTCCVRLETIKKLYDGKITTLLPTVNCEVGRGVVLASHNECVTDEEKQFFRSIMEPICHTVKEIDERDYALIDTLSGCMPAFISSFLDTFVREADAFKSSFSKDELSAVLKETFIATAMLFDAKSMEFEQVLKKVGHPGGITFTALEAFNEGLPAVIGDLCARSVKKHRQTEDKVDEIIKSLE